MSTEETKRRAAAVRLRTQPKSILTKIDIVAMLSRPEAWSALPLAVRKHLYTLIPAPLDGEAPYDPDQHPLQGDLREHIQRALLRWQQELGQGYHTKLHRSHRVELVWEDLPVTRSEDETNASPNNQEVKAENVPHD